MRTRLLGLLALFAVLPLSACASSGSSGGGGGNPDLITSEEIVQSDMGADNAYNVVRRLRPRWLRSRGTAGFGGDRPTPVVFVEGTRYGDTGTLTSILASEVLEMEYLDASDATTRFGTGYVGGAILVRLN